ncbi:MAG: peptidoglycan-binding domain-containing protein [Candidatus Sericytochromatia bacterium]
MPFVQRPQGTGQLPALPATKPAATPSAPVAPSTPTAQTPPSAADAAQVSGNLQQNGSSLPSVNLVDAAPPPEPPVVELMSKGQKNATIQELNDLLNGLDLLGSVNRIFSDRTENALKEFQSSNGLRPHGKLDAATLHKLIEAAKQDEETFPRLEALLPKKPTAPTPATRPPQQTQPTPQPAENAPAAPTPETPAPVAPAAPKTYANDFERVKDMVATQLADKGVNTDHAFEVGAKLTTQAKKWDRAMPSSSMCYTAVKRAIDDAMDIPYRRYDGKAYPNGTFAKTAGDYMLSKQPEFVKIEGLSRSDLDNLPSGAVIVYKPRSGAGHIGVQDGTGKDVSDKTRTQANVHRNAPFEVWFPIAVRGEEPPAAAAPAPATGPQ